MKRCQEYHLSQRCPDLADHTYCGGSSGRVEVPARIIAAHPRRMFNAVPVILTLALAAASAPATGTTLFRQDASAPGMLISPQIEEPLIATAPTSPEEDEAVLR
ncbi:MAG: hypothetical protein ACRD7E_04940, partial [Bryobacteraceae bacterium]